MTSLNNQLWGLISTHKMPDDASGRPFLDQLMDGHGITRDTAEAAIEEYLKFMYLCATRDARIVPSKAVDLVWHLHMQHSRDYWDVFCKKLGKPVHHNPGGAGAEHLEDYTATVAAYQSLFGTPPRGIWRQTGGFDKIVALVISLIFVWIGAGLLIEGDAPLFFGLFFLGISLLHLTTAANEMTPKGEFTLIFESGDPFADDDAGDCGSGCRGCGD